MNKFDENELRKKIRSGLQKKHDQKVTNGQNATDGNKKSEINLTPALKKYLRRLEEERLFSRHKQFIRCENHLNEVAWLTAIELAEQHEYFPVHESRWRKSINRIFRVGKYKIPRNDDIDSFRKKIIDEIENDIKSRLEKYEKLIKNYEHTNQKNRIDNIIEQEEADFYRSHPDYKLYRNYAGDTQWLTDEEYEQEEEFTDRVRTGREKFTRSTIWISVFLIVAAAIFFINKNLQNSSTNGLVIIKVNEPHGQLYIDEKLVLGFSNNHAIPLIEGMHKITYRKIGFATTPAFYEINVSKYDSVKVNFILNSQKDVTKGLVKINSLFEDAKLFVNDEFYGTAGNNPEIYLTPGDYNIDLKKENYLITPNRTNFNINAGDTVNLYFKFTVKTNGSRQSLSLVKSSLFQVSSNVKGARIFINGKDTGEKTDYVFNTMPFGKYVVTLQMEGYDIYPREKVVQLSAKEKLSKADFKLIRSTMPVKIVTRPVDGIIFIDDREVGTGKWFGSLPLGTHKIRFGKINFFKMPPESSFTVEDNGQTDFVFRYQSNFSITFSTRSITPDNINAGIQLGYVDEKDNFISDPRNGPKTRKVDILNENVWWMGNAFNYRTPPANEAIALSFHLPEKSDFGYDFMMKMWGYRSEQRYPLEISSTSTVRIEVNGTVIQEKYVPDYVLTEAANTNYDRFPLGNLLHPGKNSIIVSTAKTNKTFFVLWKVEIE